MGKKKIYFIQKMQFKIRNVIIWYLDYPHVLWSLLKIN